MKIPRACRDVVLQLIRDAHSLSYSKFADKYNVSEALTSRLRKGFADKMRITTIERMTGKDLSTHLWETQAQLQQAIRQHQITDQDIEALVGEPQAVRRFLRSHNPTLRDWAIAEQLLDQILHLTQEVEL